MIARVIPELYDAVGRQVLRPFDKRRGFHPTFPMGRYVSQHLTVSCQNIADIRNFLATCRGVTDEKQFGKKDYWLPPDQFELTRKGDCEDFSFWTWRQLMALGYDARIVFGRHGRYGIGHAWVEFFRDGACFLVEPQCRFIENLPQLSTIFYHPQFSVEWDGDRLRYFAHEDKTAPIKLATAISLLPEWLHAWGAVWLRAIPKIPVILWRYAKKLV